ncbi:hypothetical protein FG93_01363 [Bosea sp. LC85]|nr:hypothetical protein FG93_01363 [Bosea sp. LC85]
MFGRAGACEGRTGKSGRLNRRDRDGRRGGEAAHVDRNERDGVLFPEVRTAAAWPLAWRSWRCIDRAGVNLLTPALSCLAKYVAQATSFSSAWAALIACSRASGPKASFSTRMKVTSVMPMKPNRVRRCGSCESMIWAGPLL